LYEREAVFTGPTARRADALDGSLDVPTTALRRLDLMKRAWIALVAVAVLALPASALAKHGPRPEVKNAAKYCKSLRTEMAADAFRQTYGGKSNAFGKCVSQRVHDLRQSRKAALRACAQQLGLKRRSLRHEGDPNKPARKALKRCVTQKLKETTTNDNGDFLAAVRTCLAEHDADPAAFNDEYADEDGSDREAFGNCVREQLQQGDDEGEPGDDQGDDTEPGDDGGQDEPGQEEPDAPSEI
jgi:hypothetical protein